MCGKGERSSCSQRQTDGEKRKDSVVNQREGERNRWQQKDSCWAQRGVCKAKKCQQKEDTERGKVEKDGEEAGAHLQIVHLLGQDSLERDSILPTKRPETETDDEKEKTLSLRAH